MASSATSVRDFYQDASKLKDPSTDQGTKLQIVAALREGVDSYSVSDITLFVSTLLPALIHIIKTTSPVFVRDAPEQVLRHHVLETIHRMPPHEHTRQHAPEIMALMIQLMRVDNEENAILAIKISVDMYRAHKIVLDAGAQMFIDTIHEMYKGMAEIVQESFTLQNSTPPPTSPPKAGDNAQAQPQQLAQGMRSFRVLAECPIATIVFSPANHQLITPAVDFLRLEAEPQRLAREDAGTRGENHIGMTPNIKNKLAYLHFVTAQVKSMSFLAYIMRIPGPVQATLEAIRQHQDTFVTFCIRLLEDIPSDAAGVRKEMIVAVRHIVSSDLRQQFTPFLDRLMDDRLLVGAGVVGQESLRALAYSTLADLVHHLRNEMTTTQLFRAIHRYSCHLHDPTINPAIQNMSAKILVALQECVCTKCPQSESGQIVSDLLESYIMKLKSLYQNIRDLMDMPENRKDPPKEGATADAEGEAEEKAAAPSRADIASIEKMKPIQRPIHVVESTDDMVRDSRLIFRTLLLGIRGAIIALRTVEGPVPQSDILGQFFRNSFSCLSTLWDSRGDYRDEKEACEWIGNMFHEFQPHVLSEVWTLNMDFFIKTAVTHSSTLTIANSLMANNDLSRQVTSVILKHLVDRLDELGNMEKNLATVTLRLFKIVFMSVNLQPESNEPILAPHLTRIIMDSFPLAAKSLEPMNYYLLIRALFRSISGGKFDRVYNEILPLLQELLENLNRLILHSDGPVRELLVELCLTVPVRLTHLLPFLGQLMRPLVLSIKGTHEMAMQGLRTLELCLDNLTQDFLEPCIAPVLRELMDALHALLRPLPGSHQLAHSCIRILGKLGGRNRRLQYEHPDLEYGACAEAADLLVSFDGRSGKISLSPMAKLAGRSIRNPNATYRKAAFEVLKHTTSVFLAEGCQGREREAVFGATVEGLFGAVHVPDLKDQATEYLRDLSRHIFISELLNREPGPANSRRYPMSAITTIFVDWLPKSLAWSEPEEQAIADAMARHIIEDLTHIGKEDVSMNGEMPREPSGILHNLASAFVAMCHDEAWRKKMAGCKGIMIMTSAEGLAPKFSLEREFDFVRALISVLKDMPPDPPRDVGDVIQTLMDVIKRADSVPPGADGSYPHQQRMPFLVGILHMELASSNAIVRKATQQAIELLSQLSEKTPTELLMPHRERLLMPIYTKPLRALSFATQIGHIDGVTYCLSLQPPLPEANEELLRLLSEALALADADDANLLGRALHRQNMLALSRLRVACIKLLTASMPVTDFFSRQLQVRQRATSVYFKSLYSNSPEVKQAAHEGLRVVLLHQTRLPKELLQTGLRPILMNLADPKRISVSGLEGLARLLELLTNYFKVEIGVKLLEHYSSIADAAMLHEAAFSPLTSNDEITKLVKLVNIFHLLPPAASMYLQQLTTLVVETEMQLHAAAPTPFTEPFAKFVDRYAEEAADYFLTVLHQPRHVRTLRNVLISGYAPAFVQQLAEKLPSSIPQLLNDPSDVVPLSTLLIIEDLGKVVPSWLEDNENVYVELRSMWKTEFSTQVSTSGLGIPDVSKTKEPRILVSVFMEYFQRKRSLELIFDFIAAYTVRIPTDLSELTRFLWEHVVSSPDIPWKRQILVHFMKWFENPSVSWSQKTQFLNVVVNPLLLVALERKEVREGLIDSEVLNLVDERVWKYMANTLPADCYPGADDAIKIQLLQLTCTLLQLCPEMLQDYKRDIIKCGWVYISAEDMFLRQMAHVLTARFFEVYETPPKFVLRVWNGLLRPVKELEKTVEDRTLTRLALNVLAPILSKRLPSDTWIRQTRLVLQEEGHTVSALIHIYQVVVAHPDVFYHCRDFLVPHMALSLAKLGLNSSPINNSEARWLSLDVVDLILAWERRRATEVESAMDISSEQATSPPVWSTPLMLRENIVSYILRFVTSVPPDAPGTKNGGLVARALQILEFLLGPKGWPEVTVKLSFFAKVFASLDLSDNSGLTLNNAKSLAIVLQDKDDAYMIANGQAIQQLLERPMSSSDMALHQALQPVLTRLLTAIPPPAEEESATGFNQSLYVWLEGILHEGFRSGANPSGTLTMLHSLVIVQPKKLETFGAGLMRVFGRLTKDYTATPPPSEEALLAMTPLIKSVLEICRHHVALLQDQRQVLLKAFMQLIERSANQSLCQYLLEVTRDWTLTRKDLLYPGLKEKATILTRMQTFARDPALYSDYLKLIYDVFTDPALRRSELTTRLELVYLHGCRAKDPVLRGQFIDLFDESLPKGLSPRLQFVLGSSSWEQIPDQYWIPQALDLLLGSVNSDQALVPGFEGKVQTPTPFSRAVGDSKVQSLLRPTRVLLHLDPDATHSLWISCFKAIWSTLSRKEQQDVSRSMISLLSKDYHIRQIDTRVNIIQSFLAGINACTPPLSLPPYLVKYLGKTFNAWHIALEILQTSLESFREEENARDNTYDALAELYAELSEDDMFYGLWRRRCLFNETNMAISFEQAGMYVQAQILYESAQVKARTGAIAFNESEYCLWEDHWILAAQKLQQWDILMEFARQEDNPDLLLECAWRNSDWSADRESIERTLSNLAEVPTPRRRIFDSFTALLRSHINGTERTEFVRMTDETMQLALRKWASLPPVVSMAHVPLLQHFQQVVELHEASVLFATLQKTNTQNLEQRSADLKNVLTAWRERLPNLWDDISIWSDLVAWRQHVFQQINNAYLPLIPSNAANANAQATSNNTAGYRGYHETAWIINRFAHVARKHNLQEVCHTSLAKIYTLPNIEISEAFLKLREQARCHYQTGTELHAGLEVINNTNLMYFSPPQKAEFYTLKGMFIARLGDNDSANAAFGQAVQMDLGLPKAWAEWGRYNDRLFRDNPNDTPLAGNAVSCYFQAAGLYKSAKTRPLLIRILWLLSNDDPNGVIGRAFEAYKGDLAIWYWITLIPQLLQSLTYRETLHARTLLIQLAKNHPQALFFHLRTLREDLVPLRRKYMAEQQAQAQNQANPGGGADGATQVVDTSGSSQATTGQPGAQRPAVGTPFQRGIRQPWENVDEIVSILKTAFPLLALTLETMVDQFAQRFKATQEEELVRYFNALLMEALQQHGMRVTNPKDDGSIPPACLNNATRFAESALQLETRAIFKADVIEPKPSLREYIRKLQKWRDKYEKILEARPRLQPLDVLSHWLVEFQHSKFDDVEVPGQYLQHKDNAATFVRISRFSSQYELCPGQGYSYRRITILGHDGTKHSFAVQLPATRNCRREEKLHQLFRIFNSVLVRKKETRKRILSFHLPAAVPLNTTLRLLENDSSVVGLQDIYDHHLREMGISKEDPVIMHAEKFKSILDQTKPPTKHEFMNLRLELFEIVSTKMVPNNIVSNYMSRSMVNANALWLLRKQFTTQMAAVTFMSYIMSCITRTPGRYHISRSTGMIYMSDFVPGYIFTTNAQASPMLGTNEAVPFRFTPNLQHFIGPIGIEGLMTAGIMAIGRTLTEPEFDLDQYLGLFMRDEVINWYQTQGKSMPSEQNLRGMVGTIVEQIVKKAEILSCRMEREAMTNAQNGVQATNAVQSVVQLISTASNPQLLSRMSEQWLPWL